MTKFFVCLIAVAAAGFWSSSASAVYLIYEPFDYTSGQNLGPPDSSVTYGLRNTQAGTTAGEADNNITLGVNYPDGGIGNRWLRASTTAPGPDTIDIASGGLTGPSDLPASVGNSVSITNGSVAPNPATRLGINRFTAASAPPTGGNITSGTIYYSFLLRVDSLDTVNNTTGNYFLSLNNNNNLNSTPDPTVIPGQVRLRVDPADGTRFSIGTFTNRLTMTDVDPAWFNGLTVGDTHFIVGAYNVGAGTANSTRLWVNPDASTFGDFTAPAFDRADNTGAANGGSIGSLLLHQRNTNNADLTLDEIRVATTWAEVVPIGTVTRFWDVDALGSTPGAGGATPSGTWDSVTTNWNTGATGVGTKEAWTPGVAAVFSAGSDATGAYTVTVSGTQSVSSILFEDGSPTLSGGTLDVSGTHTITAGTGVIATIESVVTGSAGIDKNGAGTVVLTAGETYSGATTINAGTLQVGNGGATGTLPTASAITTNATLSFNRSNAVTQGVDFSGAAIDGTGGLTQAGSGTLTVNVANTFSGTTRAAAGTLLLTNSLAIQNSTLDLNGADTGTVVFDSSLSSATVGALGGSRNLVLENGASAALALSVGNASGTHSGTLSGSGSLTKAGIGTQTLSGSNTYAGGTTINGGALQFAQTVSMPAGQAVSGDYNSDGKTDGADYVTWRNNPGAFGGNPGYTIWRANFGANSGGVTVNNGGTLAVNAGGAGEWTSSAVVADPASIAGLIAGTGGQGTANQVTWMSGSTLGVDTTNAGGSMIYTGNIGNFRTAGGGTTNNVGVMKRGTGTLELSGNNTFSGQLSTATNGGTLVLLGTNANAGSTMVIPTVSIGGNSTVRLGAAGVLPAASLIATEGPGARFELNGFVQTVRSLSGSNGIVSIGTGTLTIADQADDDYVFGNGANSANLQSLDGGKVHKTGPGTFTLFGDAGNNFNGEFIMESGTLKLSRNQALGSVGGTGKLTVKGGWLGRSNTPTGNFTYSLSFLDLDVLRFDLSDAAERTSQFNADTLTTLWKDNVEIEVKNDGTVPSASQPGFLGFPGIIRNNNPLTDPSAGPRGITKTGNGTLSFVNDVSPPTGSPTGHTYQGPTTIKEGTIRLTTRATIGDYSVANVAPLYLSADAGKTATLTFNATRAEPVRNPVIVTTGDNYITHLSTTANITAGIQVEFNAPLSGTGGSLSFRNDNVAACNVGNHCVFQPIFTASGFDFARPITIFGPQGPNLNKETELRGGNSSDTQTFSGDISGGGSFRRMNVGGTTILSGNNTYTGNTSIDAGTLSITHPFLADAADVLLLSGGILNLNFFGTDTIDQLFFDGVSQAAGTWGASGSGATNTNDTFFSGTGVLQVSNPGSGSIFGEQAAVPEPGTMSLLVVGIGSALISCTRKSRRQRN